MRLEIWLGYMDSWRSTNFRGIDIGRENVMKFFRDLNFCTGQGFNLGVLGGEKTSGKVIFCKMCKIVSKYIQVDYDCTTYKFVWIFCPISLSAKVTPALSLSLGRDPLGAPQRQMWKSLRQDFIFTNFLPVRQSVSFFLYLRDIQGVLREDNICCWASGGKVYLHRKHRSSIRLYWKQLWQSQLGKESGFCYNCPTIFLKMTAKAF